LKLYFNYALCEWNARGGQNDGFAPYHYIRHLPVQWHTLHPLRIMAFEHRVKADVEKKKRALTEKEIIHHIAQSSANIDDCDIYGPLDAAVFPWWASNEVVWELFRQGIKSP
jgi:IS5 family transposase